MESYEVLKKAVHDVGAKAVAADMSLSSSLVYKWCEPKKKPEGAGADNPLDRLEKLCRITGDTGPIKWLCRSADGFFVPNPNPDMAREPASLLHVTQKILKEFSEMLSTVSDSVTNDGCVDPAESRRIRKEWEDLKGVAESFVTACEQGIYGNSA